MSGFLDNVAKLAPPGYFTRDGYEIRNRTAYISCKESICEPLFIDCRSSLFSRDWRSLPELLCYGSLTRKTFSDSSTFFVMTNVTSLDPSSLGRVAQGSPLLFLGRPLDLPPPYFDKESDAVMCYVEAKYGFHGWSLPPMRKKLGSLTDASMMRRSSKFMQGDSYRYFARFLLEGKVLKAMRNLPQLLNDPPAIITQKRPVNKVSLIVSDLRDAQIDNAVALRKYWAEIDRKFLFKYLKHWAIPESVEQLKQIWVKAVAENIEAWATSR